MNSAWPGILRWRVALEGYPAGTRETNSRFGGEADRVLAGCAGCRVGGDAVMETEFSMTCRSNDDGSHVVTMAGEVDVDTVLAFRDFLFALQGDVELDCGGLTFIDSGGLGTLVMYCRELDATGGHLRLTDVSDDCWRVLEVTGLTHLLDASRV